MNVFRFQFQFMIQFTHRKKKSASLYGVTVSIRNSIHKFPFKRRFVFQASSHHRNKKWVIKLISHSLSSRKFICSGYKFRPGKTIWIHFTSFFTDNKNITNDVDLCISTRLSSIFPSNSRLNVRIDEFGKICDYSRIKRKQDWITRGFKSITTLTLFDRRIVLMLRSRRDQRNATHPHIHNVIG